MSSKLPPGVRAYISFWAFFVDKYGEPSEPVELKAHTGEGAEELARSMFNNRYPDGISFRVCASKFECERAVEALNTANAAFKLQKKFGADARQITRAVERTVDRNERLHRAERERQERLAANAAHSFKGKGPGN